MRIDRREVARYLGYGAAALDPEVEDLAAACEKELLSQVRPRSLGRRMELASLDFESKALERHLKGCRSLWLTVTTLGSEADRLLRLWSAAHMGKAAVGQATAAAYMDQCCDDYRLELGSRLGEGEYLLPAFSPGYGDFSLTYQQTILDLLDAGRRIGVSLTRGGMLAPEKTVTAVVGITNTPTERCITSCMACEKRDCQFRKGS